MREGETHKESRGVLEEEARKLDKGDMEEFGTLDGGHRWRNRKGIRTATYIYGIYGNNAMNAQMLKVSLQGERSGGTVLRLERVAWSMVK